MAGSWSRGPWFDPRRSCEHQQSPSGHPGRCGVLHRILAGNERPLEEATALLRVYALLAAAFDYAPALGHAGAAFAIACGHSIVGFGVGGSNALEEMLALLSAQLKARLNQGPEGSSNIHRTDGECNNEHFISNFPRVLLGTSWS
eukprot:4488849-Amphidinium_carterae.1